MSFELPAELAELEAGLHSFHVMGGRLDRERLMFELGRESAIRGSEIDVAASPRTRATDESARTLATAATRSRFWPAATAVSMLISVGLFAAIVTRPERIIVVERLVAANQPLARQAALPDKRRDDVEPRDAIEEPAWRGSQYFAQRQIAVMQSIEALPTRSMGHTAQESTLAAPASPVTARELWKTWSEENQVPSPAPSTEPAWLRWFNPESWL